MTREFRLLNVFAIPGDPFSGNPLAVVVDATGMSGSAMQAVARQFNLSESTFLTPGAAHAGTVATVRIFTPTIELAFAGHPTLGSAAVVAAATGADSVVLGMPAGRIPVRLADGVWTLTAKAATLRPAAASSAQLAEMLGVDPTDIATDIATGDRAPGGDTPGAGAPDHPVPAAHWVDTGLEQMLVQLRSADAVRRARADATAFRRLAMTPSGEALVYLWAWTGPGSVEARLFFSEHTAIVEDPATGSACANLGSLWAAQGRRGLRVTVAQGGAIARPSRLHVEVTAEGVVRVGGLVREVGRGVLDLGVDDLASDAG